MLAYDNSYETYMVRNVVLRVGAWIWRGEEIWWRGWRGWRIKTSGGG